MKLVIQRVTEASVAVEGQIIGKIDKGLLVFLGIHKNDSAEKIDWLIQKLIHLRIFSDGEGKMNLSIQDIHGAFLIVSQFTLYANCQTGRRPSFIETMEPTQATILYDQFIEKLSLAYEKAKVQTGQFGAAMSVSLVNDGPFTFILEN